MRACLGNTDLYFLFGRDDTGFLSDKCQTRSLQILEAAMVRVDL